MFLPRNGARSGFRHLLQIGCYTKLLPYSWDHRNNQLAPCSKLSNFIFSIHKNVTFVYTAFNWYSLIYAYVARGEFSLLNALWAISKVTCFAGFLTFALYKEPLMHLANRLLKGTLTGISDLDSRFNHQIRKELHNIEFEEMKAWTKHIFLNLGLLYTNPQFHSLIVYQNPCAPNFISAWILKCNTPFEDPAPLLDKLPFLLFEFYTTAKWQYVSSIQLTFICLGLQQVVMKMNKLKGVRLVCWYKLNWNIHKIIYGYV